MDKIDSSIIKNYLILISFCNLLLNICVSYLFNLSIIKIFTLYYGFGIILTSIHRLGHSKWGGWWRKQHVLHHHIKCYSKKNFLRPSPYYHILPIHKDGNIWLFVCPSLLACIYLKNSFFEFILLCIYSYLILIKEDQLHQLIHTSPNKYESYQIIQILRTNMMHYKIVYNN